MTFLCLFVLTLHWLVRWVTWLESLLHQLALNCLFVRVNERTTWLRLNWVELILRSWIIPRCGTVMFLLKLGIVAARLCWLWPQPYTYIGIEVFTAGWNVDWSLVWSLWMGAGRHRSKMFFGTSLCIWHHSKLNISPRRSTSVQESTVCLRPVRNAWRGSLFRCSWEWVSFP